MTEKVRIADIVVGERFRRDMGDLDGLARSMAEVGLLHPVVVTPALQLIAGARRLEAAKRLGWAEVPVTVVDVPSIVRGEFAENAVREDLAPSEWVAVRRAVETELRTPEGRPSNETREICPSLPRGKTVDKVAAYIGGVTGRTLDKAETVVEAAERDPERYGTFAQQMDETGRVDRAYLMVKREQAREGMRLAEWPKGRYGVVCADPPWQYGDPGQAEYGAEWRHYPVMSMAELEALDVAGLATDNAVLFLWATSPMLPEALALGKVWGFTYKASFVWDKVRHNYGHYNSVRHELLLVLTRGSFLPEGRELQDSVVTVERSDEHSQKPEEFRRIIEAMYPSVPKVELFARERHEGWACWGDEV